MLILLIKNEVNMEKVKFCINEPMRLQEMAFCYRKPKDSYKKIKEYMQILEINYTKIKSLYNSFHSEIYNLGLEERIKTAKFLIGNNVENFEDVIKNIKFKLVGNLNNNNEFVEFESVLEVAEKVYTYAQQLHLQADGLLKQEQVNSAEPGGGGGGSKPHLLADGQIKSLEEAFSEESLLAQTQEVILKVKGQIKDKIEELEDKIEENIEEENKYKESLKTLEADKEVIEKSLKQLKKSIDEKSQIFRQKQGEIEETRSLLNQIQEGLVSQRYQNADVSFEEFIDMNKKFQEDITGLKLLEEEIKDETEKFKSDEKKAEELDLQKIHQTNLLANIKI
jgi:hypothetical protein